ncbi:MAG: hypothetical protein ACLRSW_11115 [Christensenellaceae bacterium]
MRGLCDRDGGGAAFLFTVRPRTGTKRRRSAGEIDKQSVALRRATPAEKLAGFESRRRRRRTLT